MDRGYVRLFRRLLQHPIWTQLSPGVLKVALFFLLKANYKPTQWYDGARSVGVPAGSFITSYASVAAACSLSTQQIRDAFAHLERTQFATYKRTHRWTLVTVLNWATYQAVGDEGNTLENIDRNTCGNRQGTLDKEEKNKRTICASPDGDPRVGEPFSLSGPEAAPLPARPNRRAGRELTPEQELWFSAWWSEYWRRTAKKGAREAFRKLVRTEARYQQIMAATRAQAPEMLSRPEDRRPYPTTWLNGERWEDEAGGVPRQQTGGTTYADWEPPTEGSV
jgi:hypothetical protein